ncbi:hypothetical protein BKA70DRAFT_1437573 [Coprinopsis sp. MPI-PUGE-AT-0042]|nr:hypothetical protein BKA70DRAFT_1444127 [Coprinopsis sp. MPI-PUGE-AT-0042]KAH6887225.1 hypothetical protein BKA70DRAFT_1443780 [Coprinopsis sp. MPI-PUGE-AT-0042]KAH6899434.1 hypothetical protein BKA70DRAFT_1437573 [Coprinopsis sp. MPI-PUGE-AT-0042]
MSKGPSSIKVYQIENCDQQTFFSKSFIMSSTFTPAPATLATFIRNSRTKALIECLNDFSRWEDYIHSSAKDMCCISCANSEHICIFHETVVGCTNCLTNNELCSIIVDYRRATLRSLFPSDCEGDIEEYLEEFERYEGYLRTVSVRMQGNTWKDIEDIECAAKSGGEGLQYALDGMRNLHACMDLVHRCTELAKEADDEAKKTDLLEIIEELVVKVLHHNRPLEADGDATMAEAVTSLAISGVDDARA